MAKKLFLLDGMALAYRAHFAFSGRPIFTSKGLNTSALYGFTNTLLELIQNQHPTHLAVAFDTSAPTHRHEMYDQYKANRQAMPEDLSEALPHLRRIVSAFRIATIALDGYEADDIIGTLALRAESEGFETYMVTPDKDYGQLVSPQVFIYRPSYRGDGAEVHGVQQVLDRWAIEHIEQVTDILGLAGDTSDNIPGVPKIGPKTAQKLIAKYDSIENLLDHTHELKGKQKETLESFADQARLSKELATIIRNVPLDVDLESFLVQEPNEPDLRALLVEFEFRTLARRLFGEDHSPTTAKDTKNTAAATSNSKTIADIPHEYHLVTELSECVKLACLLQEQKAFCFDTETTELNPRRARLLGIAFSCQAHLGYFVHLATNPAESNRQLDAFRPLFDDHTIEKVGHNIKFDLVVLKHHGIEVNGPLFDTMIAHALCEPEQRHGLDYLAESYLNYSTIPISQLIGQKDGDQKCMSDVDPHALSEYAAEDADITWQLRDALISLLKQKQQERVFYEIETPLTRVLIDMEHQGVKVDCNTLTDISHQLSGSIEEGRKKIVALAGHEFDLNSPKQLGVVLFDELQLSDKPRRTKTGQYATNERVLTTLSAKHEIVQRMLDYREAVKLKNTYVDSLPAAVSAETGRVHTHYDQIHAATGRLQSGGPNLQNIPIRTDQGRKIRQAFVVEYDDAVFLSADYSQIELRIIAALSGDTGMLEAFRQGMDIHRVTASKVYAVPVDDVTREMRNRAKVVNFGIPYGISAFGLAQRLNISRREAAAFIQEYFERFPGIRQYIDRTLAFVRKHGFVETVMGRRRYLRDVKSENAATRGAAERNAINMPIQGTAADMIKIAMVRIHCDLNQKNVRAKLLLQVHDELVFELPKAELEIVEPMVKECMQNALDLNVPIVVETGVGTNWLAAH